MHIGVIDIRPLYNYVCKLTVFILDLCRRQTPMIIDTKTEGKNSKTPIPIHTLLHTYLPASTPNTAYHSRLTVFLDVYVCIWLFMCACYQTQLFIDP